MRRLAIRPGGIGDSILGFPALAHLAQGGELTVWARSEVLPLLPYPTHSIEGSGITLLGIQPPSSSLIAALSQFDQVHSWYGANREDFREALTQIHPKVCFHAALPDVDSLHAADFFSYQVGAPLPAIPEITVAPHPSRLVLIHPFSGSARKNWSLESFQTLARWLESTGRAVQFLAAPHQYLPGALVIDCLGELASRLAGASLYIGNDTGITHLAAAAGANTLAIFGPTDPAVWSPRGPRVQVLHSPDLDALSPEKVLEAALALTGFSS